jgi:N-acetylglucosamine-6-phosphate deacetylase
MHMDSPVDFHCHGAGSFDFAEPEKIDLVEIDRLLKIEGVAVVLVLSLPRSKLTQFESLLRDYHRARARGELASILGIGLEGPVLSFVGGTPETGCWIPTSAEWNRIAALGQYGLVYSVFSPDAEVNLGPEYPEDILSVAKLLAKNGVMPALGHFRKSDPEKAAKKIEWLSEELAAAGLGPLVTDHLFNDMPINFKHSWRTQKERLHRDAELAAVLQQEWKLENMSEVMGPVPAAIIKQAFLGNLKVCLNFDGDHVDIEICKRAVEFIGSKNILLMTDRIPGRLFGGRELSRVPDNTLLYQADGIVAGGTQSVILQLGNMLRVGIGNQAILNIAYRNALAFLRDIRARPDRKMAILRTIASYREGFPSDDFHLTSKVHSKIYRYGQESYFQESYRDFKSVFGGQLTDCHRLTYVLFKPDAFVARSVELTLEVLRALEFLPITYCELKFDRYKLRELWRYELNVARVERYRLIDDLLCSGPSLLVALKDCAPEQDASVRLSGQKGNSNLKKRAPNSIRTKIGARENTLNFIHTPDELIDMVREVGVLLDDKVRLTLLRSVWQWKVADLAEVVADIYAQYPEHSLRLDDICQRFGESLRLDVLKHSEVLAEKPYSLYEEFASKHGLGQWDWITLVNSQLRFSHAGILPVFEFEAVA